MTDQASDVTAKLVRARDLIADPACWTHDHLAVDAAGKPIHEMDPGARAWSMAGALWKVGAEGRDGYNQSTVWHLLMKATGTEDLKGWHEDKNRTHADVIAALDLAIALSKERQ
jgi:hypothetical protein